MNIRAILKAVYDVDREIVDALTIRETLDRVSRFSEDDELIFSNGLYFDGDYDSYRGYYKDLAIGCDEEDKGFNTVGDIKRVLHKALDDGEMIGYKGGEFPIEQDTLVWFAYYGSTGEMVVDIQKVEGKVIVIVKEDD